MRARPTPRGWAVLSVALAAVVIAYASAWPALLAVGAFLAALVVVALVVVRVAPLSVDIERVLEPPVTSPGMPVDVHLAARGRSIAETIWVDALPPGLQPVGAPEGVLQHLEPGRSVELGYGVVGTRRGEHVVGPLLVRRLDPLGLASARRRVRGTATLTVLPELHAVVPPVAAARVDLDPAAAVVTGVAGEQRDIIAREYRTGDSLRHVDWRSTAHRGELMVRSEAATTAAAVAVVLDSRSAVWDDAAEFEWAVECTASLLAALAERTPVVRLVTDGERGAESDPGAALVELAGVQQRSGRTTLADLVAEAAAPDVQVVHLVTGPGAARRLEQLPPLGGGAVGIVSIVGGPADLVPTARGWRVLALDATDAVEHAWSSGG